MTTSPSYSRAERLQLRAYRSMYALLQDLPAERPHYPQWAARVVNVVDVAPMLRRITLYANEFESFERMGADEYFGLIIPPPGVELVLPQVDRVNMRAALAGVPVTHRPRVRYYTIRRHRPAEGQIDVDFVLHHNPGPAALWAQDAAIGDIVGFRCGSASYRLPEPDQEHLIVADETALPAVHSIAHELRLAGPDACGRVRAVIELASPDAHEPLDLPFASDVVYRNGLPPGERALRCISRQHMPTFDYVWACGESSLATGVRGYVVRTLNVPRRQVMFSGYWRQGRART